MDATAVGLWLAGVGATASIALFLTETPPSSVGGLRFNSPEAAKPLRIRQAIRLVAAVLAGSGSIVVAVSQAPPWWLIAGTAAGTFAAVWLHASWTQHYVWQEQWETARRASETDRAAVPAMRAKYEVARRCSRWRWALLHPFNGDTWPGSRNHRDAE